MGSALSALLAFPCASSAPVRAHCYPCGICGKRVCNALIFRVQPHDEAIEARRCAKLGFPDFSPRCGWR